jgi:hypothetical protein
MQPVSSKKPEIFRVQIVYHLIRFKSGVIIISQLHFIYFISCFDYLGISIASIKLENLSMSTSSFTLQFD